MPLRLGSFAWPWSKQRLPRSLSARQGFMALTIDVDGGKGTARKIQRIEVGTAWLPIDFRAPIDDLAAKPFAEETEDHICCERHSAILYPAMLSSSCSHAHFWPNFFLQHLMILLASDGRWATLLILRPPHCQCPLTKVTHAITFESPSNQHTSSTSSSGSHSA